MFLQALYEGIINGSILALVAMGIALIWGVMNILSFAQGEFLMLGMYIAFYMNAWFGWDPIASVPIAMIVLFFIGILTYRGLIGPVLRGPVLSQRLLTFALSMVLANLALMVFGGSNYSIKNLWLEGTIDLGVIVISIQKLVPLAASILITGCLFFYMNKTKSGKAIRATSMDKQAAELVGINTERSYMIAFGLSSAITGAAGCVITYYYYINPTVGSSFLLFGFIAVAMGGFGSIIGAFIGGLIMGVVDVMSGLYLSNAFKYFAVCVVYIVIVSIRPNGMFGGKSK